MGKSMINIENQETTNSHKEEEGEEEALSLCDFPLHPEKKDSINTQDNRKSSSDPSDFFEFFNELRSEMCHAEDIIFGGKLVPYKKQPIFAGQILKSLSLSSAGDDNNITSRRYCESLPELNPTRSNSNAGTGTKLSRSSRSLDCKTLRQNSNSVMKSEASDIHRNLISKTSVKVEVSKVSSKPRWYGLMLGAMKFPPEMELRDMRNRQVRLNTGSIFPAMEGGRVRTLATSNSERRSSWGQDFLKVLSCKNHASVATTASSITLVPQI